MRFTVPWSASVHINPLFTPASAIAHGITSPIQLMLLLTMHD